MFEIVFNYVLLGFGHGFISLVSIPALPLGQIFIIRFLLLP